MIGRDLIIIILVFLICGCFIRQRRHFAEIFSNAPSHSIRAAFQTALFLLIVGAISNPELITFEILITALVLFCVKVIFSSTIIGITLLLILIEYCNSGNLLVYETWNSVCSMFAWRFPEELRAIFVRFSFMWMIIIPPLHKLFDLLFHL